MRTTTENRDTDYGVSEVIGFVLVLGLLVLALATLQITAVPIWNEDVELSHSAQVQDEMQDVRSGILTTASSGNSATESVKLGTDYPNRVVLRSPPASTGELRTTGVRTVTVSNVTLDGGGNADGFWTEESGGDVSIRTRGLGYTPSYREYQDAPRTVYGNSVLYNEESGEVVPISGQSVIDNDRISLVSVNGGLSETGSNRVSFEMEPLSGPPNRISVSDEDTAGNITLELPTDLTVENWRDLLEDEAVGEGGNVVGVSKPADRVRIELSDTTNYTLRTAKVGVGNEGTETDSAYITDVSGDGKSVPAGTTVTLVAEVRDRYSNGVSGETVVVSEDTGNRILGEKKTTDPDGRVRFSYDTTGLSSDIDVELGIEGGSSDHENVTFGFEVFSSGASSTEGGGAYSTFWVSGDTTLDVGEDGQNLGLTMGTDPIADGARVEYAVNDSDIGEVSPDRDSTNSDGRNETVLTAKKNGTVKVYTSSGGSGDDLNVTVENFPSQAVVYNDDAAAYDIDGGGGQPTEAVNFSITNTGGDVRITDMVIESPAATKLLEGSTSSPWDSEVRIDSNDGGFANEGNAYSLGNSIAAYEDEGTFPNDLTAGETATVYMHKFLDDESNQVDMDGKQVTTTFSFQNRDPVSFTFTPTRPPTVFNSLTADATFQGQGNSGQIDTIDFNGSINNPDTNGVVRIAVIEGSDSNNNSVNMAGSFDINNVDTATGSTDEVDIVAELVNNDGDAYQTCQATLNQGSDPLSLADFSCSTGLAQ